MLFRSQQRLEHILTYGPASRVDAAQGTLLLVLPRPGTISPWSSKATDIARHCGLEVVQRIERGTAYWINGINGVPAAQAAALTATQVNAMETVDLQTLAATQIAALSTSVISHLLTLQMQNLLDSQIASLTTTQVGVLTAADMAGEMRYLTDRRAEVRRDPRNLLPGARSVICVGKLYNQPLPEHREGHAIFSRYALGHDYHDVLREALEQLAGKLAALAPHEWKACVDTAPLLERSYARQAGLGWIGRNTCLINEPLGSWFFLGEILTTLELAPGSPPPDRCGTCTRCIDACPTSALIPGPGGTTLDSRRCISYLTIELRGSIPDEHQAAIGDHVFGCDICQDVCPWNRRAPVTMEPGFRPQPISWESLTNMNSDSFRTRFRSTPVERTRLSGLQRNLEVVRANRQRK